MPIKISYFDIEDELKYWESFVICCILGANPPVHVIEGFIKRIWKDVEFDKVGLVAKGIYLVHMKSMEGVTMVLESNGILFEQLRDVVDSSRPWILLGDFNCIANYDERVSQAARPPEVLPLRTFISACHS